MQTTFKDICSILLKSPVLPAAPGHLQTNGTI